MLQLPVAFCHNAEQDAVHPPMELPLPLPLMAQLPKNQKIQYITHMIEWPIIIREKVKEYLERAKNEESMYR